MTGNDYQHKTSTGFVAQGSYCSWIYSLHPASASVLCHLVFISHDSQAQEAILSVVSVSIWPPRRRLLLCLFFPVHIHTSAKIPALTGSTKLAPLTTYELIMDYSQCENKETSDDACACVRERARQWSGELMCRTTQQRRLDLLRISAAKNLELQKDSRKVRASRSIMMMVTTNTIFLLNYIICHH